jgi:hypothetical protein
MSILSWLGLGKAKADLEAAEDMLERELEPRIEDAAQAAKKLLGGFESDVTALFTKLANFESDLVDEIDSKTGILTDVRQTLDKLRSIGVGPVKGTVRTATDTATLPTDAVHVVDPAPAGEAAASGDTAEPAPAPAAPAETAVAT